MTSCPPAEAPPALTLYRWFPMNPHRLSLSAVLLPALDHVLLLPFFFFSIIHGIRCQRYKISFGKLELRKGKIKKIILYKTIHLF